MLEKKVFTNAIMMKSFKNNFSNFNNKEAFIVLLQEAYLLSLTPQKVKKTNVMASIIELKVKIILYSRKLVKIFPFKKHNFFVYFQ